MKPTQWATKIHEETCGAEDPRPHNECIAWIAAQIRAAMEDQRNRDHLPDGPCCKALERARAEAYEDAAKILEGDVLKHPNELTGKEKLKVFDLLERLAATIRAKAKEACD